MFAGKRVLVAGGAGFVGTNLTERLVSLGARVRATVHHRSPRSPNPQVEYSRCDLLLAADCTRAVEDMDCVFMCAANTSGAAVIANSPLVHVTPNIIMNAQLMEAAYHARVEKFVFLSSSVVYPPSADRLVREEEMLDGDPYDVYYGAGWMKRYSEILCRMYSEKLKPAMQTVVVRPSNIYGPHDDFDPATSHVMAATIRKVVERQNPIRVWGSGDDIRDLIYIDDFIDGLLAAALELDAYNPVNLCLGKGYSIKQLLQVLMEIEGSQGLKIEYDPTKPSMIPIRLLDAGKAERLFGFRAGTDIREGMTKTIAWYRTNYMERGN